MLPFFTVFGIPVFAGRLALLTWFVIATVLLYRLTTRLYDERVAGWACVLFVTSPAIGLYSQRVQSEIPTVALTLAALIGIERFPRSERLFDYLMVVLLALAGLLCRPTALYMFPACALFLLVDGGAARLTRGSVGIVTVTGVLLMAIAAVAVVVFSPFNATIVADVLSRGVTGSAVAAIGGCVIWEEALFVMAVIVSGPHRPAATDALVGSWSGPRRC